jgi:hypothetical protein
VPQQQVVQAVVVARHEDRDPLARVRVGDAPAHREALGGLADRVLERQAVGVDLGQVEVDALEELPGRRVGVLVGVQDVGAVACRGAGRARDDAAPVRAVDEKGRRGAVVAVRHRARILGARRGAL